MGAFAADDGEPPEEGVVGVGDGTGGGVLDGGDDDSGLVGGDGGLAVAARELPAWEFLEVGDLAEGPGEVVGEVLDEGEVPLGGFELLIEGGFEGAVLAFRLFQPAVVGAGAAVEGLEFADVVTEWVGEGVVDEVSEGPVSSCGDGAPVFGGLKGRPGGRRGSVWALWAAVVSLTYRRHRGRRLPPGPVVRFRVSSAHLPRRRPPKADLLPTAAPMHLHAPTTTPPHATPRSLAPNRPAT